MPNSDKKRLLARAATTPKDYKRLGVKPGTPELWEDALRTTGKKGEFEWWYFDGKF